MFDKDAQFVIINHAGFIPPKWQHFKSWFHCCLQT